MNREMQVIREVNIQAENFYGDAVQLGDHAAFALGRSHRSQMTGLENIADSAFKTSDIFDYIKRQIARFPYWRQNFPKERHNHPGNDDTTIGFGERLISYLEQDLVQKRDAICSSRRLNIDESTDENQHLRRRIYLLLIRQFVHQMVAEYEFRVNVSNTTRRERN